MFFNQKLRIASRATRSIIHYYIFKLFIELRDWLIESIIPAVSQTEASIDIIVRIIEITPIFLDS
jgi:hypothetical protein